MKKTFAIVAVAGLAGVASAQSVGHSLTLTNTNSGDSAVNGALAAQPGDTIQVEFAFTFSDVPNAVGVGGGQLRFLIDQSAGAADGYDNGAAGDFNASVFGGRSNLLNATVSDAPAGSAVPGNSEFDFIGNPVTALDDLNFSNGVDLVTNPPNFGGTPVDSGVNILGFSFVYQGGTIGLSTEAVGAHRVFDSLFTPTFFEAPASAVGTASASVTPAPASLALLGLGGLAAGRRRRA